MKPETLGPRVALAVLLAFGVASAVPARQDPKQELQRIEKELEQESKELRKASQSAVDDDAVSALYRDYRESILPEFAGRYAALARANAKSPIAFEAWMRVAMLAQEGMTGALPAEALAVLTSDHIDSEDLDQLTGMLRYGAPVIGEDKVIAALRTVAERSPHRAVKASALYNLGAVLGEERPAGDPRLEEAKTVLARCADFSDVKSPNGRSYAESAVSLVFALEHLVVGKPCPDFAAVDVENAKFRLSDYKGKVVLVDFWGFW